MTEMWWDCAAWLKNEKINMNTTSNEACKFFDCALTQLVTWTELEQYSGIAGALESMLDADPDFFLGHVLKNGLDLVGTSSPVSISALNELKNRRGKSLTDHELLHYNAIVELHNGNLKKACDNWEHILIEKPFDMMALKFAHDCYFYSGSHPQMRDSLARVIPKWSKSKKFYSNLHSMYSFGLVQSNYFEEAKKAALYSLEMNKDDALATHTICHYNEYKVDPDAGIKFLRDTEPNWSKSNLLAGHNYWHMCLYHLERNEHDVALGIYDNVLLESISSNRIIDYLDLSSLLYRLRLDMSSFDLRERWTKIRDAFKSRFRDHFYLFNDIHSAMIISSTSDSTDHLQDKQAFFDSFQEFTSPTTSENGAFKELNRDLGGKVFESFFLFDEQNFEQVVELLYPIRYSLIQIGGSNAQRDVLAQILIQSALRSKSEYHNKIGLSLLNEREGLKPNSKLTERLKSRFASNHYLD